MPSASIRKKVCGLIKTKFSHVNTAIDIDGMSATDDQSLLTPTSSNSFISKCILNRLAFSAVLFFIVASEAIPYTTFFYLSTPRLHRNIEFAY